MIPDQVTFEQLVVLEPRLQELFLRAREIRLNHGRKKPFTILDCRETWYGESGLKNQMWDLVGWYRKDKHPVLGTQRAYDVAYQTLFRALTRW